MRMMSVSTTAFGVFIMASSAFAQSQPQEISQPTTNPATTSSPPGTNPNEVVCRPVVHLGSLIATQDCRTKQAWDAQRFRNQQELNQVQTRGLTTGAPGH